jgi:hypothetical protein
VPVEGYELYLIQKMSPTLIVFQFNIDRSIVYKVNTKKNSLLQTLYETPIDVYCVQHTPLSKKILPAKRIKYNEHRVTASSS